MLVFVSLLSGSDIMTTTNFTRFQEEMEVFFRNNDIVTTTERNVTTTTNTLTSTGATAFTLSNTSGVRNIRYVTMAGVTQTMYRDLTPSYTAGTITFTAAPSTGTSVVVNYDRGSSDRVYGDLPREDIDRLNYPRLMVKVLNGVTKEFALGGDANITDYLITAQMWSTTIRRLNTGIDEIRDNVLNNKKNFYYCPFVTISHMGAMQEDYTRGDKIFTRAIDLTGRFVVERMT